MNSSRRAVAATVLATLVVASGCVGFISGDEALSFEASEGSVSSSALEETGYEHSQTTDVTATQAFEVAGQSRDVTVTNYLAEYGKSVDLGILGGEQRAAVFVAFTTPKVEVLGRTFNPVGEMSNRELLGQLQSQYSSIEVGQQSGSDTVTALGTEATVERFDGRANIAGTSVDIYVHITKIEHGDDYVVAVGVYPQRLDGEGENVLRLVSGLSHEG